MYVQFLIFLTEKIKPMSYKIDQQDLRQFSDDILAHDSSAIIYFSAEISARN